MEIISHSGKIYFSLIRPNGYPYIDHHVSRSHQLSDTRVYVLMKEGETAKKFLEREPMLAKKLIKYDMSTFDDKYRKQKWHEPCSTIFAHLQKDGNRFIHPEQARTLTPREAARIQAFPDDIFFEGPYTKKFIQIGNAVPVWLSYSIAQSIYNSLLKRGK